MWIVVFLVVILCGAYAFYRFIKWLISPSYAHFVDGNIYVSKKKDIDISKVRKKFRRKNKR